MLKRKERRHYPRVKIKLPVVKMAGDVLVDGEIQDLSLGGAFIRCTEMPNAKDNFHMVISAKGRLLSITGEVAWKDIHKSNDKNRLRGMGVRFTQILNSDLRFIRDVLAKHYNSRLLTWLPRKCKARQKADLT